VGGSEGGKAKEGGGATAEWGGYRAWGGYRGMERVWREKVEVEGGDCWRWAFTGSAVTRPATAAGSAAAGLASAALLGPHPSGPPLRPLRTPRLSKQYVAGPFPASISLPISAGMSLDKSMLSQLRSKFRETSPMLGSYLQSVSVP
jgi:hypothetical protein